MEKREILLLLVCFNTFLSSWGFGNYLNSPHGNLSYYNEKTIKSGSIELSIYPIRTENGDNGINIRIEQSYYHHEIDDNIWAVTNKYKYYYGSDVVKVVCTKQNGKSKNFRHEFEEKKQAWHVQVPINPAHIIKINQSTGWNVESNDVIEIYVNGVKTITCKIPSKNKFSVFTAAAEENAILWDEYMQKRLNIMSAIIMMNGNNNNNNNNYDFNRGSSNNSSSVTYEQTCSTCKGKGWIPGHSTPTYVVTSKYYSNECGEVVNPSHSHDKCPSCNGRGHYTRIR